MDDVEYDKMLIELDMSTAKFNNNTKCDFYFDILEPIRNVAYVKIMKCVVGVKPLQTLADGSTFSDGDSIYIALNDYYRITAVLNQSLYKVFETIDVNMTQTYNITSIDDTKSVIYTKDYTPIFHTDDASVYKLNPTVPSLNRFNVHIFNKSGKEFAKNDIQKFKILLCVYSNNKKF